MKKLIFLFKRLYYFLFKRLYYNIDESYEYKAFISYNSTDEKWAKWLHYNLEYYHIPSALCEIYPELPKQIRPVYWYKQDMSGTVLKKALNKALNSSRFLIVISSPDSAQSDWVNDEIDSFIKQGKGDKIIPFIVKGTPHATDSGEECFPPALLELGMDIEIRGIDIHRKEGKYHALVDLIATMFELPFDYLWMRHVRRRRRITVVRSMIALLLVFLSLSVSSYVSNLNSSRNHTRNILLLDKAKSYMEKSDPYNALRHLMHIGTDDQSLDANLKESIVHEADNMMPYVISKQKMFIGLKSDRFVNSDDGLLIADIGSEVRIFSLKEMVLLSSIDMSESAVTDLVFSHDNSVVAILTDNRFLCLYDVKTGRRLLDFEYDGKITDIEFNSKDSEIFYISDKGLSSMNLNEGFSIRYDNNPNYTSMHILGDDIILVQPGSIGVMTAINDSAMSTRRMNYTGNHVSVVKNGDVFAFLADEDFSQFSMSDHARNVLKFPKKEDRRLFVGTDGSEYAVVGDDNICFINSSDIDNRYNLHQEGVRGVSFISDTSAVSYGKNSAKLLLKQGQWKESAQISFDANIIDCCYIDSQYACIFVLEDGSVWRVEYTVKSPYLLKTDGNIRYVDFLENGECAVLSCQKELTVYNDNASGIVFNRSGINDFVVTADGQYIVAADECDRFLIYDVKNRQVRDSLTVTNRIDSLIRLSHGDSYAYVSNDSLLLIQSVNDKKVSQVHVGDIEDISFTSDGTEFIGTSDSKVVRFALRDDSRIQVFGSDAKLLMYSPDGRNIIYVSDSDIHWIHDFQKENSITTDSVLPMQEGISSIAVSNYSICYQSGGNTVWQFLFKDSSFTRIEMSVDIAGISASPKGDSYMVTTSDDYLHLFHADRLKEYKSIQVPSEIIKASYSFDGKNILVTCKDGLIYSYRNLSSEEILEEYKSTALDWSLSESEL